MPDFTGEHIRDAAQWLEERQLAGYLERECVFTPHGTVDFAPTFERFHMHEHKRWTGGATGLLNARDGEWHVAISDMCDLTLGDLTRGHEFGHVLLNIYYASIGYETLRQHHHKSIEGDAFLEATAELIGYYCMTPRRYWDCLKAGGLEEL